MSSSSPRSTDSRASSGSAEAAPSPWRRASRLLLDHLSFDSARARTLNLSGILFLLAIWPTESLGYVPARSVWVTVFGWEPYSTGTMRALSRLMHGDLAGAYAFNKLVFVTFAVMVCLIVANGIAWARQRRTFIAA